MNKLIFTLCIALFLSRGNEIKSQPGSRFNENELKVKWELVANNYQDQGAALSAFTLVNKGKKVFPASGWTLYFNSSQPVVNARATAGVEIVHVNGDIYKITPGPSFTALKRRDSVRIEYYTDGMLINYTAVPCGLYIVWEADPAKGYSLADYAVRKLENTTTGIVTPEKVFRKNRVIKDIPAAELPKVFPTPVSYRETAASFTLDSSIRIEAPDLFRAEAGYLSSSLEGLLKKSLSTGTGGKAIRLKQAAMGPEAYRLSVSAELVEITAATGAGIFYGIQSLFSLFPADAWANSHSSIAVPGTEVKDEPRFGYRSFLLDIARNFKSKETLFKVLDLMALYKMNVLHLHFSDDEGWRIEIPSLPELTEIGARRGHTTDSKSLLPSSYAAGPEPGKTMGSGYYTRADYIEILKYATLRHIRVMPEIESPGHSRAAVKAMDARYEKYIKAGNREEAERYLLRDPDDQSVYSSAQQWTDNVICVARPSAYHFMEKVIGELQDMYREAGAPLETIHLGGDEVPAGAWERSPLCQQLIKQDPQLEETNDLWYYYFNKLNAILRSRGLFLSGWEEAGMRKTKLDGKNAMIVNPRLANEGMQLHVWNNVTGWGAEDLPYRLANAGYKVVLSPVSNNYLDLAYYKHPDEPGYYWGGFQDIDKPFDFIPFDYYKTSKEDPDGNPADPAVFVGKDRLTDFGKSNIVGIQGLLWGENMRSNEQLDYLLLPKLLGVAERAWAPDPAWATEKDSARFGKLYGEAWSVFVNVIGKRELPRLDHYAGGFGYRIPAAGAILENGKVLVNSQFPGLLIKYSTDGSEPLMTSKTVTGPLTEKGIIKIRVFDSRGRGGRTISIENP
ncbi:MAG: carbohydate-binding domain-containing protein [Sphingobacteriales bacterium]|nr:carbohydate-binding domain-containing protein [Sphingobacteriales bacterium]